MYSYYKLRYVTCTTYRLYTTRHVKGVGKAVAFNKEIDQLHPQRYTHIFDTNYFQRCPLTVKDSKRAIILYGQDKNYLQGKTTKNLPSPVPAHNPIPIPTFIRNHHLDVSLYADLFFVQGTPLLHTISRNLTFRTIGEVATRFRTTMIDGLQRTINIYKLRNFRITNMFVENEFEYARNALLPIILNVVVIHANPPEIKLSFRTVNESI